MNAQNAARYLSLLLVAVVTAVVLNVGQASAWSEAEMAEMHADRSHSSRLSRTHERKMPERLGLETRLQTRTERHEPPAKTIEKREVRSMPEVKADRSDWSSRHDSERHSHNHDRTRDDNKRCRDYQGNPCVCDDDHDDPGDDPADDPHDDDPADDPSDDPSVLELRVDQQVKVADGEFVDAETAETSPEGVVGDTVIWKTVVSADATDPGENRDIQVDVTTPDNVDVNSVDVSTGTYDNGVWTLNIGNLPATLTAHSVLTQAGFGSSTATIARIECTDPSAVNGWCPFTDVVNPNNSNPAGVVASAASTTGGGSVLGTSTGGQGGDQPVITAQSTGQVLGSGAVLAETGAGSAVIVSVGFLIAVFPLSVLFARRD